VGEELNRLIDALAAGSQRVCWEGQTLVVDTTNVSPNSYFMGSAENVLEEAQELEPVQRSAVLDRACLSDQSLRREVEACSPLAMTPAPPSSNSLRRLTD
jgi:hypothetical protein